MPIVCVLDRGCNMGIPFLSSFAHPGFTTGGGTGKGAEISSADTHGTYCAGIVAHTYITNGGNPGDLRIMPVAIGTLTVPEVVEGIDEARKRGAQIISLSQEFPASWLTADINAALDRALNQNIVVCVATGNDDSVISYPATHSGVMAVGACTGNVGTANRVTHTHTGGAWGSNFGSQLSVVALGLKVNTSYLGGRYREQFERTSAATPQVAALAALILGASPTASNKAIQTIIQESADQPSGVRNDDVGYGRINIPRTIQRLNGVWSPTGNLATQRSYHTATLLLDGTVLVAGGSNGSATWPGAELYDPATETWRATGDLMTQRRDHTATLLLNGHVLVAGGHGSGGALNNAELYDPVRKAWSETGSLTTSRGYHSATLLPDGKVLVVGGEGNGGIVQNAELYDPARGKWSAAGNLRTSPGGQNAPLLDDGKVLIAGLAGGNESLASAELYDTTRSVWGQTRPPRIPRFVHTATRLSNGKVLVVGGWKGGKIPVATAELYDPTAGTWRETADLSVTRRGHTATLLSTGRVLVVGGKNIDSSLKSTELYDPTTGIWSATGALTTARHYHSATLLPNGKVLITGGKSGDTFLSSVELFGFSL